MTWRDSLRRIVMDGHAARVSPPHWAKTYGVEPEEVLAVIDAARREAAELEALRTRAEAEGD